MGPQEAGTSSEHRNCHRCHCFLRSRLCFERASPTFTDYNDFANLKLTLFCGIELSLQGSLRNLALDVVPGEQLATASAWHGRFSHFGNILGYALGSLNLANAPILKYVGGGQFRKSECSAISRLVKKDMSDVRLSRLNQFASSRLSPL